METTYSPWIYHEIGISKIIKNNIPNRLQPKIKQHSFSNEELKSYFQTNTSHLFELDEDILNSWIEKSKMRGAEELNYLYRICANRIYRYKSKQKGVYNYEN